jgi:hypothetical protein
MAHVIMHHNGVYNVWSTIVDAPLYESALTFEELSFEMLTDHGRAFMEIKFDTMLKKAQVHGCSNGDDIESCWEIYRQLHRDISIDEFVSEFLTAVHLCPICATETSGIICEKCRRFASDPRPCVWGGVCYKDGAHVYHARGGEVKRYDEYMAENSHLTTV